MKMQDIRTLARERGVKIGGLDKTGAIRRIQAAEGNFDCFGRARAGFCDQAGCLFHADCMKQSALAT